jgi:phosphate transport system permease protein
MTEPRGPRRTSLLAAVATGGAFVVLLGAVVLLAEVTLDGWGVFSGRFLFGPPSRFASEAGIGPALVGTLWLAVGTVVIALPVGVGAALYLEEYAGSGRVSRLVKSGMISLAGIPSVVYGILGLAVFVRGFALGQSILAAALTLAALAVPTVFVTAREAVRAVPDGLREAAYGLGATRWQVVRDQVLPAAAPGIVTGSALAFSRTVGETAPLLVIGAVSFVTFAPASLGDPFTSLPTQIYAWIARPDEGFRAAAAGAIIVLLLILLSMNVLAAVIRRRFGRSR